LYPKKFQDIGASMKLAPQQIKLLVIDIDGTLLDPHRQITPQTRAAIQAAQAANVIVTLATGRGYSNSFQIANELGIAIPVITYDGALILHHPDRTVIHTHTLAADIAQQATDILVEHHIQPIIHRMNGAGEEIWTGHADFDNPELAGYFAIFPHAQRMDHATLCTNQPDPLRVVGFASQEALSRLASAMDVLDCAWHTIERGNYDCSEIAIMNKACSKASSVITLARHLNISLSEVMAIGDNVNDLEMLQAVGWGVAMGQASATIKAAAHAVTASNAEDGVALAIERYIFCRSRDTYAASNSRNRLNC
jgi:Cof subfamily protein (haloacid dehalogenase superfamily)